MAEPDSGPERKRASTRAVLQSFGTSRSGNIAVIFTVALIPILQAVGCAVDYTQAAAMRTKLQACADASIMTAVDSTGMKLSIANAQTASVTMFNALCSTSAANGRTVIKTAVATATDSNNVRTAVMTFTAARDNDFMGIVGMPKTNISGSTTAKSAQPTFIDIYSLLDDSPSMGLAATTADQAKMKSLTGCEFACHTSGSSNTFPIAQANSVKLRIDVLRESWINLIKQAQSAPGVNNFRIGTYTFDSTLNLVQAPTSSFSSALATAENIGLKFVPSSGPGSTYADLALTSLTPQIASAGDGATALTAKKYVIMVTDGVQDFVNPSAIYGHQTLVVTASQCTALKNKGIQLAVIYTTYLPLPENTYIDLVKPFANNIAPALQNCASPDLYFQATQASDIQNAFDAIFKKILAAPRFTK